MSFWTATISPALLDEFSLGCYDLAAVEESFVLAFARTGDNDPNHLYVTLNRAYRVSWFDQITRHRSLSYFMCSRTASQGWVVSNCFGAAPSFGDMARSFT